MFYKRTEKLVLRNNNYTKMYIPNMVEFPKSVYETSKVEKKDNEIRTTLEVLTLYQPLLVSH